ncbi:NAD(P)-binding protein [Viridothelium virens]|uniref:NAD(P)-binding protein n=1 Tax=Viridothelium virens TaxID=1048519 RepID=A0A6A6H2L6_VIRVR|nr:NAD(P)-binding protein [Viridothelium virens]
MAPQTMKQWNVVEKGDFEKGLKFSDNAPVPSKLKDNQVLVHFHAASLNFRDLTIVLGTYLFPVKDNVVPSSDGAGTVEAVGSAVKRFKPGDKVVTLFNQGHLAGAGTPEAVLTGLGGMLDGSLRQYGAFDEHGLVHMPNNLNFLEASTLTCAGLTAWNALYGLQPLKPGEWVLTQGTGGVSIFALQFAKAAGAKVIATTSSAEKAEILKKLGADHVINYKQDLNWGESAKKLTPAGEGVDHVVEIGGPVTVKQSLAAIKIGGVINIIGFVGGEAQKQPTFLDCLKNLCTVRGLLVGSRQQFEDMIKAVDANNIHPVIDQKVFKLHEAKEAFHYQFGGNQIGKVCIEIE